MAKSGRSDIKTMADASVKFVTRQVRTGNSMVDGECRGVGYDWERSSEIKHGNAKPPTRSAAGSGKRMPRKVTNKPMKSSRM